MAILAGQPILALDFSGDAFDFETANDTSTSTTYVAGTTHGVAFVAPTSGSVWVRFGGLLGNNSASAGLRSLMSFYLRTGDTIGAGTDVLTGDDSRSARFYKHNASAGFLYNQVNREYLVTGLTAGADYNVITVFRAVSDTAAVDDRWISVGPAF